MRVETFLSGIYPTGDYMKKFAIIGINDTNLINVMEDYNILYKEMTSLDSDVLGSVDVVVTSQAFFMLYWEELKIYKASTYVVIEDNTLSNQDILFEKGATDLLFMPLSKSQIVRRMALDTVEGIQKRFEIIQEVAGIGVWEMDYVENQFFASTTLNKIFDLPVNQILHYEDLNKFIHPEDLEYVMSYCEKKMSLHTSYEITYKIVTAKSRIKYVQRSTEFHFEEDRLLSACGTIRDVSEEMEISEAIKELSERMALAAEAAEIGVWDYDISSGDLIWDLHMFKLHDLKIDTQMLDLSDWLKHMAPDERYNFEESMIEAIKTSQKVDVQYKIANGEKTRYLHATATIVEENMKAIRLIGVCYDVTERVLHEENLKSINESLEQRVKERTFELEKAILNNKIAQARLDTTLSAANVGFWEWYVDLDKSYENEQWFNMLGYSSKEFGVQLEPFYGLMHPEDKDHMLAVLDEVAAGNIHTIQEEFRLHHKDGRWIWIMARGKIIEYEQSGKAKTVSGVHINISTIKESEKQLKLLSAAITTSPITVIITEEDGSISYVNPAFEKTSGYAFEEVKGHTCSILKSGFHDRKFYETLWETIRSKKQWRGEFLNKKKNGDLYWESASITPMLSHDGSIYAYIAVKEDITEKREHENEIIVRNKRLTRQQWMLQNLTRSEELTSSDINVAIRLITEAVTNALEISMCSVLLFGEMDTLLSCKDHYNRVEDQHMICDSLRHKDFSNYFFDILAGSQVTMAKQQVSNAYEDMRLYLENQNIYASLHFPIWLRGHVVGVVLAGHEIDDRSWLSDEISFIRSISDLITITMETNERLKAQDRAEEAAKVKSDFLANMSHEIRTPMNAIIGLSHLVMKTKLSKVQYDYMNKINEASNHLLILINDILDFSKVEAGMIQLETISFSLSSVLINLQNMMEPKLQEKSLSFQINVSDKTPDYLNGDPYRLSQILINLVSNAIKFTSEGSVSIFVNRVYSDFNNDEIVMLQFDIQDTGAGMSEATMDKLFESFVQGDSSISRTHGGTGLGLSICKQLVDLFHGEISVESSIGHGSTFTFTANFALDTKEHYEANRLERMNATNHYDETVNHHVVLAEDNEINQEIILEILKVLKISVVCVNNGKELIEYMEKGDQIDLILMDIQMPELNGYETSKIIRSKKMTQHIPIIALSADTIHDIKDQVLSSGMNDFVGKPIEEAILLEKVRKWLAIESHSLAESIPGLNMALGLKYCNRNIKLYQQILRKVVINHHHDIEMISKLILKRDEAAKRYLHSLKGILKNIGAEKLAEEVAVIETALKTDNWHQREALDDLQGHFDALRSAIEDYLISIELQENEDDKVRDDVRLKQVLQQLMKPLKSGSINEIRYLQKEMDEIAVPDEIAVACQQMQTAIKKYKFDAAQVIVASLIEDLGGTI